MNDYQEMQMLWVSDLDELVKGRVNFGVSQLPLFNLLKPECTESNNFWTFKV